MNLSTDMAEAHDREKEQKFLFDRNIFDEDFVEEPEEPEPPPPPTFSEAELEAARSEGYARGRKDAARESAESREQFIAAQLEVIAKGMPQIFAAESQREKQYELESVKLAALMFRALFPVLNERHGLEEILEEIAGSIREQEGRGHIVVEVSSEAADGVRAHLETLARSMETGKIEVAAAQDLKAGSCRLKWSDGGSVRDAPALAKEVESRIVSLLTAQGSGLPGPEDGIEEREAKEVSGAPPGTGHAGDDKRPHSNDGDGHE